MAPSPPAASLVVPCFGKWHVTERCLESLEDSLGSALGSEVEVVVVDNGSPDETAERLRAWEDRVTVVSLRPNRHFSGGCNAGARAARGDVIVFLNNDVVVRPGVLEALVAEASDPAVGAAGLRLLYGDGTIQHGGVAWYAQAGGGFHPFHLFRHEAGDLPAASVVLDLDAVTGACLAIRRELFLELGGFDEGYRSGFEDLDLCVRLRLRGLRVVYRGDLWLVHDEGLTRGRNNDERENRALFMRRWGSLLEGDAALLRDVFDAEFNPGLTRHAHPGAEPWGASVSVEGEVAGLAPGSREARALLRALGAAAAREWQLTWVAPCGEEVGEALSRPKRSDALVVHVPATREAPVPAGAAHVLRLAAAPDPSLPPAVAVWAASEEVARAAIAAGVPPERVDVLRPVLPAVPLGPGGGGVLAIVPAEDPALAAKILSGLAGLPCRVVPTALTAALAALAGELLPEAELLAPVSSEARLLPLLGAADVVVCGAVADAFDRTALLAAAAGAVPVTLAAGPAAAIVPGLLTADPLAASVAGALADGDRAGRAAAVAQACGPAATAARLQELVAKAFELRAGRPAAVAA